MEPQMHASSTQVYVENSNCNSGRITLEKRTIVNNAEQQMDVHDKSKIINQLVLDRLEQIQAFGTKLLEEELKRTEDENKTLKEQENILMSRVFQLEKEIVKKHIQQANELKAKKKFMSQINHEREENIVRLPSNNGDKEMVGKDVKQLSSYKRKYSFTESDQYGTLMQATMPLHNSVENDCRFQNKNMFVYTPVHNAVDSDHSQLIRNYIPYATDYLHNKSTINKRTPHVPIALKVSWREQAQNNTLQLQNLIQLQALRKRRPASLGPRPDLIQGHHRHVSDTKQPSDIAGYQFQSNTPAELKQLQSVHYGKVSYQPPFIKIPLIPFKSSRTDI